MAQYNICLALITLLPVLHGTAHPLSGPIRILMEMAHSFSSIQQISCQIIAFLCSDRRPAYFVMLIIKDQCPVPFLSHTHY